MPECRTCAVELVPGASWAPGCHRIGAKVCRDCSARYQRAIRARPVKLGDVPRRKGPQTEEHKAARAASVARTLSETTRQCARCAQAFTPTSGHQKYCSGQCWNAIQKPKRDSLHRISISPATYAALAQNRGETCAICDAPPHAETGRGKGRLAVDHDHTTGQIRGLLCHRCNTAIGLLRDDAETVMRAAVYLEAARSIQVPEAA
jgi:hypothetical protein